MSPGGKRRAEDFRKAYFHHEKQNGNESQLVENDYFTDEQGAKVGITWSEEPDGTWFLNLRSGKFDDAILLCQTKPDGSLVVRLPRVFLNRYRNLLSRDTRGQFKFNIVRERGTFYIRLLRPAGLTDISSFVSRQKVIAKEIILE